MWSRAISELLEERVGSSAGVARTSSTNVCDLLVNVLVDRFIRVVIDERSVFYCFFFQAEDGIRDLTVTGVQTCALPICATDRTPGNLLTRCKTSSKKARRCAGATHLVSGSAVLTVSRLFESNPGSTLDSRTKLRISIHIAARLAGQRFIPQSSPCRAGRLRRSHPRHLLKDLDPRCVIFDTVVICGKNSDESFPASLLSESRQVVGQVRCDSTPTPE